MPLLHFRAPEEGNAAMGHAVEPRSAIFQEPGVWGKATRPGTVQMPGSARQKQQQKLC